MSINNLRSVYFLGIGGIGMSALARFFKGQGVVVSGYDRTETTLTRQLTAEGISVHFDDNVNNVPESPDLVIYTPAIPKDHKELQFVIQMRFQLKKRSEVLGMITEGADTIAIAGTHGKTTVTSIVAHILSSGRKNVTGFLGGISKNYHSNLVTRPEASTPGNTQKLFVVEADEFDRSFLTLHPKIAVITSADADHLDIYGSIDELKKSFSEFTSQICKNGTLIIKDGIGVKPQNDLNYKVYKYSLNPESDFYPENLRLENGRYLFDLVTPMGKIANVNPGVPGKFNLENSLAAAAAAFVIGIPAEIISSSLSDFMGVERRFDLQVNQPGFVYIDDYAHHPEELKACIRAVKEIYPGKKITGVFQPHLYSRTRDFADEFARSLELLDELILLEIYPAREIPIPGVNSKMLLEKLHMERKRLCNKEELFRVLRGSDPEVLLTLGAGDIDQLVKPIREMFLK